MYDTGIIVKSYRQGKVIQVDADLTAGHKGHMEFRISALGARGDSDGKLFGELLETVIINLLSFDTLHQILVHKKALTVSHR